MSGLPRHRRDELDGRSAHSDHPYPLTCQVVVVVPASGVEPDALEGLQADDVGHVGHVELAQPIHEDLRTQGRVVGRAHGPAALVLGPGRFGHLHSETDPIRESETLRK